MTTLLLGKNGQVGWELQRSLAPLGPLIALDRHGRDGLCGDLSDLDGLRTTMRELRPRIVVNAAAYTAVDGAEEEPEQAARINAEAPAVLAEEAKAAGALLIHYSTDYVFDGSGTRAWREEDPTGPLNRYGLSKLAGEEAIRASGCRHLIFRTSWVYAARGANFLATMSRLIQEREALSVIDDQIGAPTGAELIADVTAHAIQVSESGQGITGTFHLAASGETSWHGYARYIAQVLQEQGMNIACSSDAIKPIPASEWPLPAPRPFNSRLDTGMLERAFNLQLPPWQAGVKRALSELIGLEKEA